MKRAFAVVAVMVVGAAPAHADDLDAQFAQLTARPKPRYLRPALEEGIAVGLGAAWYWLDRARQVADWDFPSWKERFNGEAWRFDNNPFPINWAWHAIDGAQYHLFARTSDLSMLESMGYGLATSFAWEWGLEFREKVSINDMITTTGAGTAVGEFFHWLGRYFESAPDPRAWHHMAKWLLTPTRTAHNQVDDRVGLRPGTTADALGLSSDIAHRFVVSAGAGVANDLGMGTLTAGGELAAIPGYLTPRTLRRSFREGNVSAAHVKVTAGDDAIGLAFSADTMLAGIHQQTPNAATTIGVALAYGYRKERFGDWEGRVAQMHLPGIAVDQHVRAGWARIRVRGRAHLGFAGLDAAAYAAWAERHAGELVTEKTILRKHGYYYGVGMSARLDAEVALPRMTLGASAAFARYESIEGLDRSQEEVTDDIPCGDRIVTWDAWARVFPLRGRAFVEARIAGERDDGHVGEVQSRESLTRLTFAVGAVL